ncbi:DeoR/GlpR family DNA-binding transcription regulator [Thermus thermophilus]|uniref:DeoR family transcriptional regulator n=1 Tax=Thermus thermophilus TaxID=274 RepID=A0A7R7TG28_THETH|nr:DeoR/GlpR family DNA-binding transcription regulator [Thermus thermophilus]BCP67502.1 DeoR family transcriptional regulator [Thermus thermophilus]
MKPAERRRAILDLLETHGEKSVEELARIFGVSQVTIRNDLADLEARGLVQRTYGGAVPVRKVLFNPSFEEKKRHRLEAKRAIALRALEEVREGDALILDAGSTTLILASLLKGRFRKLFVLTNSIPVALELQGSGLEVLVLGGQMRHHSLALIGPATVRELSWYRADKAFLGATGVDSKGFSTPNPLEAETKRAMVEAAGKAYILADSTKLNRPTLARFASLEEAVLVTDAEADPQVLWALEAAGARVWVADLPLTGAKKNRSVPAPRAGEGGKGHEEGD